MANPEHFRILQKGINAWNLWRAEHPEIQPDLNQADRTYAHLRRANLRDTALREVKFFAANLLGADLQRADLSGADLMGAVGLTQRQIDSARGDHMTKLPRGLRRPSTWASQS